jgi:hypothetical protein
MQSLDDIGQQKFPLNFDPGIPVVVYESRIQKFRKYEIQKNN